MNHHYEYVSENIILQPLCEEDLENVRVLRNKLRNFFFTTNLISPEGQKKWYGSYLQDDHDIMFKVVRKTDSQDFIGAISLCGINMDLKTAEMGRVMVDKEKAPEKGIGTEVVKAVCGFAFDVLGMEKVYAEVLSDNLRALRAYQKAGFQLLEEKGNISVVQITK